MNIQTQLRCIQRVTMSAVKGSTSRRLMIGVLVVVFIIPVGCRQGPEFKTYTNDYFEFRYPATWIVETTPGALGVYVRPKDWSKTGPEPFTVVVHRGAGSSLASELEDVASGYAKNAVGATAAESTMLLGGWSYRCFLFNESRHGGPVQLRQAIIPGIENTYVVGVRTVPKRDDAEIAGILSSFRMSK